MILLVILQPPPPDFSAHWQRPGVVALRWQQPAGVGHTCLYRQPRDQTPILMQCWSALPFGPVAFTRGDVGPMDASARPAAGDSYVLTMDGARSSARLESRALLPVFRR